MKKVTTPVVLFELSTVVFVVCCDFSRLYFREYAV